ncbi:MAG TPA: hypothetical protein VD996_06415 [Chitinophagaceae bacterium]|nr:hypothetical protein [Chitinophagaceae bacterium]
MRFLAVCLILLTPAIAWPQSTSLPLNFRSYAIKLGIAKDETMTLTTRAGEIGIKTPASNQWRRADTTFQQNLLGQTLDQSNFFNKDTGFVSGFIANGKGQYDLIYHTTDGGNTWQTVNIGQSGWVDDAIHLNNGQAWLSISGSGMAYTSNYGFTWTKLNNPEPKQRFTQIFFNTQQQGIVGSLWNMIAYTPDNCKTWQILPTPLDQNKYKKTNKQSRPAFNRVAIFQNYFLANQEDLVFYTHRDSINWTWLPEYGDFHTDPENSALFFKTNKNGYVRVDNHLQPTQNFEPIDNIYDAKCKNGSLFIASNQSMVQLNTQNQAVSHPFTTNTIDFSPAPIGYTTKGRIGELNNIIHLDPDYSGEWKKLFTLPFHADSGSLSVTSTSEILYSRYDDSLFYFNLRGKLVKATSRSNMLSAFGKKGIRQLIFSEGSQGCFHRYEDKLLYTRSNGKFGGAIEIKADKTSKSILPDNEETIEESDVTAFINKLPQLFDPYQLPSFKDLGFTEEDFEEVKRNILALQKSINNKKEKETLFTFHRNNLDFQRLLSLVDSVQHIEPQTLDASLRNLNKGWSTTTNWKKIELVNYNNEVLTISSNYYEPNAFYFPWTVSLNGFSVITTNIEINRFIANVYPTFLQNDKARKTEVLQTIVKDLY